MSLSIYIFTMQEQQSTSVSGVAVSMVAFQAIDPGSTPGSRSVCKIFFDLYP